MINLANHSTRRTRRTKTKKLILASVLAGAMALPFVIPAQKAQAENPQQGNPYTLAGTWREQVGAPPGPTFTAYETFTEAGGSVEINNGPGGSTTGIGTWARTENRTFLATLVKQKFDDAGSLEITIKVRREITLSPSGNEFSGRDNVDLYDPAGNRIPIDIPSAPFHGTRIVAEPLTR